jgi:hypothetical protein
MTDDDITRNAYALVTAWIAGETDLAVTLAEEITANREDAMMGLLDLAAVAAHLAGMFSRLAAETGYRSIQTKAEAWQMLAKMKARYDAAQDEASS